MAFALDPARPDSAARAAVFREAGFEVMILASTISADQSPEAVADTLEAAGRAVPEAIGVLDMPDGRIAAERPVLDAVVGHADRTGQALLGVPGGFNELEQSALRADVPAATLFRVLDDEDQRATVITRFLARAEFAAQQDGAVIVVGRARPDTVTALFSWALSGRDQGVAIAPVSEILRRSLTGG